MHGAFERTAEANSGQRGRVQGERTTVSRQFEAQFVQMSPYYLSPFCSQTSLCRCLLTILTLSVPRPSLCRCLLPIFIFLLAVISSGLAFIFGFYMGLSYASIHTQCSSPLAMLYTPCNITVLNCSRLCVLLDP
uniref:Uncharacterized protein n=1 Tax=Cacopsylla melanoneura TaxID=428564 RepID=A0A8D9B932_9HEMI